MQDASHSTAVSALMADLTLHLEHHFETRRLKRGMLAMLAAWLGYFALISMSARSLNKLTVPLIESRSASSWWSRAPPSSSWRRSSCC